MKATVKLKPGDKGTKRLHQKYGDALVCVRYRYDAHAGKQIKTVELIVSESEWSPPPGKFPPGTLVHLTIGFNEKTLQEQARSLGGRWNREKRLWIIPYGAIKGTRLERHVVGSE